MPSFDFNLTARRNHFTSEEILDAIRAFAATSPPKQTSQAFDAWPARPFNARTATIRFGSWRHALKAAGLKPGRPWQYTNAELITALEETWKALGRPPGKNALYRRTGLTDTPYRYRWGSIAFACEAIARCHQGKLSRKKLLNPNPPNFPNRRTHLSPSVRYQIMKRDNFRCTLCGARATDSPGSPGRATDSPVPRLVGAPFTSNQVTLEIDHIHPQSRGGKSTIENLRTLCRTCNQGKRDT